MKRSDNSKKKILIVEDEPFLVDMYRARFEQEGFSVSTAFNGTLVMDMIERVNPDLVLLDIVMPEKDGYAVLKDIRSSTSTKKIPVIVFSNLAQDKEIQRGLELGADDYIIKSDYTPAQLVANVRKLILKSKQAGKRTP